MAVDRVVVVGCGSIGQRHARLLAQRIDVKVELCDPNPASVNETKALIGDQTVHFDFNKC